MAMKKGRGVVLLLSTVAAALLPAPPAAAARTSTPARSATTSAKRSTKAPRRSRTSAVPALASSTVAALTARLRSGAPDDIAAALAEAATYGSAGAALAPAIEDLLVRGTTPDLCRQAMQSLGAMGQPSSSAVVAPYARHRHVDLRREAMKALLKTGGPDAVAALRAALSDPDAGVRGLAATGLGGLHAHDALPDLFVALDHGIAEAAGSIGQICNPEECEKLAARTGAIPFDVMTSGFDQILFRPANEVPDDEKIKIIGRIRELGTPDANQYLRDVDARFPKDESARVKQALGEAIAATGSTSAGTRVREGD